MQPYFMITDYPAICLVVYNAQNEILISLAFDQVIVSEPG